MLFDCDAHGVCRDSDHVITRAIVMDVMAALVTFAFLVGWITRHSRRVVDVMTVR